MAILSGMLGLMVLGLAATPAAAHDWGYGYGYGYGYPGWREQAWREHEWREQAWREQWYEHHHARPWVHIGQGGLTLGFFR